jgi:hypothetical protein
MQGGSEMNDNIERYVETSNHFFLRKIAYEICTATKIEIRGKIENPFIHLEYKDEGNFTEWIFAPDHKTFRLKPIEKIHKGCLYRFGETRIKRIFARRFYHEGLMKRNDIWKLFNIIGQKPKEWQNFMYDNILEWYCKDKDSYPDLFIKQPNREKVK